MRALGVDPGEARVGLAASDGTMAFPVATVARSEAIGAIQKVLAERSLEHVIVGLPLRLDGTEGPSARRARAFIAELERAIGHAVIAWDERLTTTQAERALAESGVRGAKRKAVVDQAAAVLLLQSWLDAQRSPEDPCNDPGDPLAAPPAPARAGRGRASRAR